MFVLTSIRVIVQMCVQVDLERSLAGIRMIGYVQQMQICVVVIQTVLAVHVLDGDAVDVRCEAAGRVQMRLVHHFRGLANGAGRRGRARGADEHLFPIGRRG